MSTCFPCPSFSIKTGQEELTDSIRCRFESSLFPTQDASCKYPSWHWSSRAFEKGCWHTRCAEAFSHNRSPDEHRERKRKENIKTTTIVTLLNKPRSPQLFSEHRNLLNIDLVSQALACSILNVQEIWISLKLHLKWHSKIFHSLKSFWGYTLWNWQDWKEWGQNYHVQTFCYGHAYE